MSFFRTILIQRVKESLVRRIDKFGVSEPEITTFGASRIVVKLPGLQNPERAKKLLGKTARLEFRLVRPDTEIQGVLEKLDRAFLDEAAVAQGRRYTAPDPGYSGPSGEPR